MFILLNAKPCTTCRVIPELFLSVKKGGQQLQLLSELTVQLHELFFRQQLIVHVGDAQAAFRQQQRGADGRNDGRGVNGTGRLRDHFDGRMLC